MSVSDIICRTFTPACDTFVQSWQCYLQLALTACPDMEVVPADVLCSIFSLLDTRARCAPGAFDYCIASYFVIWHHTSKAAILAQARHAAPNMETHSHCQLTPSGDHCTFLVQGHHTMHRILPNADIMLMQRCRTVCGSCMQ